MKQLEIAEWVNLGWIYHKQDKQPAQRECGTEISELKDEAFEWKMMCAISCIGFAMAAVIASRYALGW